MPSGIVVCGMYLFAVSAGFAKDSVTPLAKAAKYIEEGKRLDSLANIENENSQRQFEQALEKYLCAARAGSAEGAVLATSITLSGMAPRLSDDSLRLLYQLAIDSGRLEGCMGMAELSCEDESSNGCKDPGSALMWLSKAMVKSDDGNIPFRMGEILLDGSREGSDSSRAFACFKRAGGKGARMKIAKILKSKPRLDTTLSCEPKP